MDTTGAAVDPLIGGREVELANPDSTRFYNEMLGYLLGDTLPDCGVEPLSGVSQVVSEMSSLQSSPDSVIVDLILRESERYIVPHRARDQSDGLRNVRDQAGIAAHDLPRRQATDPDRTRRGLHNPEDGICKRGLAAPRRADDCKSSARWQREGDPV